MIKQIALSTNESYQLAFLKGVVLNHSTNRSTASFRTAPCSLTSISKKPTNMKWLKKSL